MRSRFALVAVVSIVLVSALDSVAAASEDRVRVYRGRSSQDIRAEIALTRHDGVSSIVSFSFGTSLTCEDGIVIEWYFSYGFGLDGYALDADRRFVFDDVGYSQALHLAGRVGPREGDGTLRFTVPGLTADEEPMLCSSGDVTWHVRYRETLRAGATSPVTTIRQVA